MEGYICLKKSAILILYGMFMSLCVMIPVHTVIVACTDLHDSGLCKRYEANDSDK